MGNYETLSGGFPAEAFEFLTNVPSSSYQVNGVLNANTLWAIVQPADDSNFTMSVWTNTASRSD